MMSFTIVIICSASVYKMVVCVFTVLELVAHQLMTSKIIPRIFESNKRTSGEHHYHFVIWFLYDNNVEGNFVESALDCFLTPNCLVTEVLVACHAMHMLWPAPSLFCKHD